VPRAGLSPQRVVDIALEIIDGTGVDGLTLARLAQRAGVATPSLYKHVAGLPDLRRLIRLRVLAEFDESLRAATLGHSGAGALRALATAYRRYLRTHPHRAPFIEAPPEPADPETTAAIDRVVEVAYAAVRGYGLIGADAVHAIRCVRSAVHGFAHLEATGGFGLPEDIDTSFERLLRVVADGVAAMATAPVPAQGSTTRARK
jgi:AcrR family transcriptional regulator